MLLLPNGNKCSDVAVHPKDWKTVKRITENWYIHYRFYPYGGKRKQVIIKTMNEFHNVDDRRRITKTLYENELYMLKNRGYNPTLKADIPESEYYEISPLTGFIHALKYAREKIRCSSACKNDLKSIIKYLSKSAFELGYSSLRIGDIRRKHIRLTLDNLSKIKGLKWTDNNFNHYRRYLSLLFTELVELEAVEFNPVRDISKRRVARKIKEVTSTEQRIKIDQYFKKRGLVRMRIYMRIFFHSGSRSSELLSLKTKDINLAENYFTCTIRKGKDIREIRKTIKDISIPYWKLAMKNAKSEDYVFGKLLNSGEKRCPRDYITHLWEKVKKDLGIKADFYSLKHSHTTEVVDLLDSQTAATINGHTDTNMVAKVYDIRRGQREHNKIKNLKNAFI